MLLPFVLRSQAVRDTVPVPEARHGVVLSALPAILLVLVVLDILLWRQAQRRAAARRAQALMPDATRDPARPPIDRAVRKRP